MPFPKEFPQGALKTLLNSEECLYHRVEASYDLLGYALDITLPEPNHERPMVMENFNEDDCPDCEDWEEADCCSFLEEKLSNTGEGVRAFPWREILPVVLKLLDLFLSRKDED